MGYYSGANTNVVKTALDSVFFTEFNYENQPGIASALTAGVFMQDNTDRAAVIVEQLASVGYWEERGEQENLANATPTSTRQKTFSVLNFAKQLPISKNMFDDDQHSTVQRLVADLARKGRLTRDKNAFKMYNLGFTSTLANDSVALFSNSHTTINGTTVDNLLTSALSESALEDAIKMLLEQKTQDDTLGGHVPTVLLVPPKLFPTAIKLTMSELTPESGNNAVNYVSKIFPGLKVYQSPFLGTANGGSDTAWFLLSNNHSMSRWERQDIITDLVDYKYSPVNEYIYKAEYREVVGPISWEGLVGSTGAGA
jgi:phage major head subunit gpT-like protein